MMIGTVLAMIWTVLGMIWTVTEIVDDFVMKLVVIETAAEERHADKTETASVSSVALSMDFFELVQYVVLSVVGLVKLMVVILLLDLFEAAET